MDATSTLPTETLPNGTRPNGTLATETLAGGPTVAPPGLKGLVVADTRVGDVRGAEGFFHYGPHDATEVAERRSFAAVAHLLLEGRLPDAAEERAVHERLGTSRADAATLIPLAVALADVGHEPLPVLRALLSVAVDPRPLLDLDETERREAVWAAIGVAPTVVAAAHRRRLGLAPIDPDPTLGHAADHVRMITGTDPSEGPEATGRVRAVERYLSLTADHGFNASTFTARVIASTGADVGGCLAGALGALSGPLHGGAPSRVLDMIDAIGDPTDTERWATALLDSGGRIMGFGHAVYAVEDPRARLLRATAIELGGDVVDRSVEIERRLLALLAARRPDATIQTNVEYWAAVVMDLAGIPQEMFTPTFAVSRIVGWGAHVLEQAASRRIIRPSARYVGEAPSRPVPAV